jgi:hypothetical protein
MSTTDAVSMSTTAAVSMSSTADDLNFAPRSQHELRALASMVFASLQFLPMQVMVLQGEDGADGLASSFDLLQTAVLNSQLGLHPVGQDAEALARSKQATLERLQADMAAIYVEADWKHAADDFAPVQRAYEIFCAAFRSYLLDHYAISSRDLRFFPLAAVDPDSLLMKQGSSHWNAGHLLSASCDASGGAHFGSYSALLRAYALDLATLERDLATMERE